MIFNKNIYYVDEELLEQLTQFRLIASSGWYQLFESLDGSHYRMDIPDKLQQAYFTRIDDLENWDLFDDTQFRIDLLREHRGVGDGVCKWSNCNNKAINNSVFCECHAYEMGVRK